MSRLWSAITSGIRHPVAMASAVLHNARPASNLERWQEHENLDPSWDTRTIEMAGLIPPGSDVIEFGAARLVLRDHLPAGCTYQPSDIIDRGEDMLVCDLNRGMPVLPRRYTHAVFSGVLEYVRDVPALAGFLSGQVDHVVASYATWEEFSHYLSRLRWNWVNHYRSAEFVEVFEEAGFVLNTCRSWNRQSIFLFSRTPDRPSR